MNIIKKLFQRAKAPTEPETIINTRYEPEPVAYLLTPERLIDAVAQAAQGQTADLFQIYRDIILTHAHTQAEFAKRKLAVLAQPLNIMPWNPEEETDRQAAEDFDKTLSHTPGWLPALAHLLESTLYPCAIVEKTFANSTAGYRLAKLTPVPHHLLDYTNGTLRIRRQTPDGRPLSTYHDPDPNRYIIHRSHLLSAPDTLGGPMRAILFWFLISHQNRDWWANYLRKNGTPFIVGKYQAGDQQQRQLLQRLIHASARSFGVAISSETDIAIHQAAAAQTTDAYQNLHQIANREISKLILGQTLSSESQPTGLGSGTASLQSGVRDDIRRMDSSMLADTLREQLITQLHQINNAPGTPPYIQFGNAISNEDKKALADIIYPLKAAGLGPTDEAIETISEIVGFPLQRVQEPTTSAPDPFRADPGGGAGFPTLRFDLRVPDPFRADPGGGAPIPFRILH